MSSSSASTDSTCSLACRQTKQPRAEEHKGCDQERSHKGALGPDHADDTEQERVPKPCAEIEPSEKKTLGLFDLPPELRNRIYPDLLQAPDEIEVGYADPGLQIRGSVAGHTIHPHILATCRAVNGEATPVLYGANEFKIQSSECTYLPARFVRRIGTRVSLIRHHDINAPVVHPYDHVFWSALDKATGVETLDLRYAVIPPTESDHRYLMELLCKWARKQRQARVGMTKKDPIEVLQISRQLQGSSQGSGVFDRFAAMMKSEF